MKLSGIKKKVPLCIDSIRNYSSDSGDYASVYTRSLIDPENFWAEQGETLTWHRKWDNVLDTTDPHFPKWFSGGEINVCYNAIDRHIKNGLQEKVAIVYDSPVTNTVRKITYRELHREVSRLASGLRKLGIHERDTVLIYMPMIPEAIVTMLACSRLGAIHSLVFGGFAARELAVRIKHCQPKVIVTANLGIEPTRLVQYKPIVDEAIKMAYSSAPSPKVVVYQRPQFPKTELIAKRDLSWNEVVNLGPETLDCVPVDANQALYVLYTSGTTGDPKGVVRPCGGHAVALSWSLKNVYGMNDDDVWWAASDLGWVVGHSFICYAPLINGITTVLYEGKPVGTPDPGAYFRVLAQHGIRGLFTAPTALRAIRKEDPQGEYSKRYNFDKFEYLFVAGEHCDSDTMEWAKKIFKVPALDNWWQTEAGSPMTSTCAGLTKDFNTPKNSSGKPVPGWNFKVVTENNTEAAPGEMGRIVAKLPLPPGFMTTLYKNENRFIELYFSKYPGMYDTMDAGKIDEDGNVYIMARDDDVINVAGHRISTKSLEEALLDHPDIIECAVIGVPDELKGEIPLGICILNKEVDKSREEIGDELVQTVRQLIGPVAAFKNSIFVNALPKTRSGKIARKTLSDLARGKIVKIPSTIEDASVYNEIQTVMKKYGFSVGTIEQSS